MGTGQTGTTTRQNPAAVNADKNFLSIVISHATAQLSPANPPVAGKVSREETHAVAASISKIHLQCERGAERPHIPA